MRERERKHKSSLVLRNGAEIYERVKIKGSKTVIQKAVGKVEEEVGKGTNEGGGVEGGGGRKQEERVRKKKLKKLNSV